MVLIKDAVLTIVRFSHLYLYLLRRVRPMAQYFIVEKAQRISFIIYRVHILHKVCTFSLPILEEL